MEKVKTIGLPNQIYDKLIADFPISAYSAHKTKSYLTTLKAQYIVERLNEVFGACAWNLEHELISFENNYVLNKGRLVFKNYDVSTSYQYGGKAILGKATDKGDAFKSAVTEVLSKCASLIGIGNEMFKGNVSPPENGNSNNYSKNEPPPAPKAKSVEEQLSDAELQFGACAMKTQLSNIWKTYPNLQDNEKFKTMYKNAGIRLAAKDEKKLTDKQCTALCKKLTDKKATINDAYEKLKGYKLTAKQKTQFSNAKKQIENEQK